ncbi:TonB-dependent receptor [uncultured Mailhella sp.]|uniref:TonB-dependent receptor plug domain-containing protein n=1 Tax=uncultured Mailhella sp. TaxID=1981031 RepID=UPI003208BE76
MKKTTMTWTAFSTVLLACALLPAPLALAEETVKAGDVYVTATRVEKELQQVPMSVTVMTAEDVRRSGARTVGELLEDVPGVQVQNDGSQGLKRISIRGEDAFRTLVLIDGQKISEHKSMSGSPMLIDASRIERIEVIKGPASVLYGSDAIGGVVNIITKKGGEKPVEGEVWTGFSGASRGFSEGMAVRGNLDGFKYSLSGSHSDQGNIHTPEGELDNTNFRQTDASAFLSYDFSEHFTVGAGLDYYKGAFNSTSMKDNGNGNRFFVRVPKWARTKYYLFAEGKDISEYLARVRFDAYYQKNEKDMRNYVGQASGPGSTSMNGRPVSYASADVVMDNFAHNIIRSRGISLQTDWQLGADHYLIAGYELNYDRLNSDGRTYLNNRISMSPVMSILINKTTDKYYDGNQLNQSLFASMESQLPWNLALTYGVRWTHVRTELTRGEEVSNPYTGTMQMGGMKRPMFDYSGAVEKRALGDDTNSRPVFNVGLVWTGIEDLALRASWAQGFRVPNLTEKYIGTAMGGGTIYGNPNLDPETSNNFEIGARYNHGALDLDLAFFYSIADNYIASVPVSSGSSVYTYTNVADATTFGSELSAGYRFSTPFGDVTPYASLTWMRRQYDDGNGWKTYDTATPEWVGRYGVRYAKALAEDLDFRADVYGRSQSATVYRSSSGSSNYDLGGFTTANIALGFDFGPEKQFSLLTEVLNIFDKRYQYNTAILEPGLHANVKLSYRF